MDALRYLSYLCFCFLAESGPIGFALSSGSCLSVSVSRPPCHRNPVNQSLAFFVLELLPCSSAGGELLKAVMLDMARESDWQKQNGELLSYRSML